jgi:hypothetical protein
LVADFFIAICIILSILIAFNANLPLMPIDLPQMENTIPKSDKDTLQDPNTIKYNISKQLSSLKNDVATQEVKEVADPLKVYEIKNINDV